MNTMIWTAAPDVQVGDILLIGRFGGAYCNHWRVERKLDTEGKVDLVRVEPRSIKNADGTFSSVWEVHA